MLIYFISFVTEAKSVYLQHSKPGLLEITSTAATRIMSLAQG